MAVEGITWNKILQYSYLGVDTSEHFDRFPGFLNV